MRERGRAVKTFEFGCVRINTNGDGSMIALKVAQFGEDMAFVLNDEARELLGVKEGDTVYFEAAPEGGLRLAKLDMSFEARRERGRAFLKRYQKTFDALAK
jgi:hypothetical protein